MQKQKNRPEQSSFELCLLAHTTHKTQWPSPVLAFAGRRQSLLNPSLPMYVPFDVLSPRTPLSEHLEQVVCHCNDCKRTSGSAFSTNAVAPSEDVKITGPVKEYKNKADSGNEGGLSAQVVSCRLSSSHLASSQSPGSSVENVDVPSRIRLPAWETTTRSRVDPSRTSLRSPLIRKVSPANIFWDDFVSHRTCTVYVKNRWTTLGAIDGAAQVQVL